MTFNQMVDSIYRNSMGHVLNGEKHTKEGFREWFSKMFKDNPRHNVVYTMKFPDGEWICLATQYSDKNDGYDYYVPDTRGQETELFKHFFDEIDEKLSKS